MGTVEQPDFFRLRVVISVLGIYAIIIAINIGRPHHVSPLRLGIVMQGIRDQTEFGTDQFYLVVKRGLLGICMIFPPVGSKDIIAIYQLTAIEEVGIIVKPVIIKGIRIKRLLTMLHHDILPHFSQKVITIIIETGSCK